MDTSAFQKTYFSEMRKLHEMERRLLSLKALAGKAEVEIRPWDDNTTGAGKMDSSSFGGARLTAFLEDLEGTLVEYEGRVVQMSANEETLEGKLAELIQLHDVIVATAEFLDHAADEQRTLGQMSIKGDERPSAVDVEIGDSQVSVGFVAGVLERKRLAPFQRVLWRSLRGNVIIRSCDIPGDAQSAFVAFVHGRETLGRVRRICEALGAKLAPLEGSPEARRRLFDETAGKIDDLQAVLINTREAIKGELQKLSGSLEMWHVAIRRQMAVYGTLNRFSCDSDVSARRCFIAEGWAPKHAVGDIDLALKGACEEAGLNMVPVLTVLDATSINASPPTRFPTNKLTVGFQEMTDAYGVATYGEANPAVYMIITFPFLFAVMFGDIGHGMIMALAAGYLVAFEAKLKPRLKGELWEMVFGGRYVILLMGLFSVYTGLIYNDCFSKTLSLFPSMFYYPSGATEAVRKSSSYVYPFGLDPTWEHAENGMTFLNSYKMKQSILLGLVQMTFGLVLSLGNMVHFGETLDVFCTFLPQLLFMSCLFGYLGVLIVVKWITAANVSLLNLFIAMVLRFGAVEGQAMYPGQRFVQGVLVMIAFACVPWMLLAKPAYLLWERRKLKAAGYDNAPPHGSGESISSTARKVASEEEHGLGDLMVHQLIHTIEFVLGSVSNTASYLRLWALSLAHAQLSAVLWDMTIAMTMHSTVFLVIGFAGWFTFTLGVMVGMEGMSAFLHALRLHWVEFNNKFYRGGGTKFEPFSLDPKALLAAAHDSE